MVVRERADENGADLLFHALSDPTRRDILARTLRREHSVSELASLYPMSFAAVQRHVAVLAEAQLVTKRAAHRHRYVRGNPHTIETAARTLDRLLLQWTDRLDRFEVELAHDDEGSA